MAAGLSVLEEKKGSGQFPSFIDSFLPLLFLPLLLPLLLFPSSSLSSSSWSAPPSPSPSPTFLGNFKTLGTKKKEAFHLKDIFRSGEWEKHVSFWVSQKNAILPTRLTKLFSLSKSIFSNVYIEILCYLFFPQ